MKSKIIITCVIMLGIFNLKAMAAQIVPIPSSSMTKADGVFINTTPAQAVLVTATGNATLTGEGDTVVIEQGGTATINGNNEKVYIKRGGTATINGSNNTTYYEEGAQVTANGIGSKSIQVDSISVS